MTEAEKLREAVADAMEVSVYPEGDGIVYLDDGGRLALDTRGDDRSRA